jgi:predicted peptidase
MFEEGRTALWYRPQSAGGIPMPSPWPLLLFLHGIGERGTPDELATVARWGLPKLRAAGWCLPDGSFPFLVVAPQCPPGRTWCDGEMLDRLTLLIDRLTAAGTVDRRRLYLTGFSMGGIGTFCLALRHPGRFTAIAPICGRCLTPDALGELAHLPAWIGYAIDDEIEDLARGSEDAAARLAPYGRIRCRGYRLGSRDGQSAHVRVADEAYRTPELYRWLLTRNPRSEPEVSPAQRA